MLQQFFDRFSEDHSDTAALFLWSIPTCKCRGYNAPIRILGNKHGQGTVKCHFPWLKQSLPVSPILLELFTERFKTCLFVPRSMPSFRLISHRFCHQLVIGTSWKVCEIYSFMKKGLMINNKMDERWRFKSVQHVFFWRQNTRYKSPQLVMQHSFVARFGSMFRVFHVTWSTCRATKAFVAGWRNMAHWLVDLLGVDPRQVASLMRNEQQSHAKFVANSGPTLYFSQQLSSKSQQKYLLYDKLITQGEKRETLTQNLQGANVAWQVAGFCIS